MLNPLPAQNLTVARGIQESLLPRVLPCVPGFTLAGFCRPAREVGGDYYDAIWREQTLLMIIADVMGSGLPAAMFAARLRMFFQTCGQTTLAPSEILSRTNKEMFEELSSVDTFITAQVLALNTRTRRLTVANAGHCPALLADASGHGQVLHLSPPDGMPLGIFPDSIFPELTMVLQPGACALLYTDGIPEATNDSGDFFGHDYLEEWFAKAANRPHTAASMQHELRLELNTFQARTVQHDDQTAVVFVSS